MKNILVLALALVSQSSFAATLCGVLNDDRSAPAPVITLSTNSDSYELETDSNEVFGQLEYFSMLYIHARPVRVCVEGDLAMHDEDKGNLFDVSSVRRDQ